MSAGERSTRSLSLPSLFVIGLGALLFICANDAGAVEFAVTWDEVQVEVRPRTGTWNVAKTLTVRLEGGNATSEEFSVRTKDGYSAALSGKTNFRDSTKYAASWHVEDSNTIVRTWTQAQHVEILRIVVSEATCRATISYHLKPGFLEYRMLAAKDKQPLYFIAVSAQNILCRASVD